MIQDIKGHIEIQKLNLIEYINFLAKAVKNTKFLCCSRFANILANRIAKRAHYCNASMVFFYHKWKFFHVLKTKRRKEKTYLNLLIGFLFSYIPWCTSSFSFLFYSLLLIFNHYIASLRKKDIHGFPMSLPVWSV